VEYDHRRVACEQRGRAGNFVFLEHKSIPCGVRARNRQHKRDQGRERGDAELVFL
jgi:hypothetical protein